MLETSRTYLRKLTSDDAESFFKLNENPNVIKYTGDLPFANLKESRVFLENYDQHEKYNVGRYAVILKENNQFIGWCGLKYSPNLNEYDIGFRFFEEYWGKGLATETAQAVINDAFVNKNIKSIIGRAEKENIASIKVLDKIGLRFKENKLIENKIHSIYIIDNK